MLPRFLPFALVAIAAGGAAAQAPHTPPAVVSSLRIDSGSLDNPLPTARVVFRTNVKASGGAWLQVRFGEAIHLPDGSFVRMTSLADLAVQHHTAATIAEWANQSAMFNGDEVVLELIAAPNTTGNRVSIDELTKGLPNTQPSQESICGAIDDRLASNDPRVGRLRIGCTGWMIGADLMLTAGHCQGGGLIIEFNVPLSTPTGTVVRSHPDDQYPFVELGGINGGVGTDWGLQRVGRNSNTNLLPTEANGGQWFTLGPIPSSPAGQNIRITGYGSTSPANQLYLAEKTHVGPLSTIAATSLCYATDTTGGNSGSPIIHENTGNAIGIHTHGGCTTTGGCNSGTRADRGDLRTAIQANSGTPGTAVGFGAGCAGSAPSGGVCGGVNPAGGTLTNSVAANEYAYQVGATGPMTIVGFELYLASTGGSPTINVAFYPDAGGVPAANPTRTATLTVGPTAGFHAVMFAQPINVGAGTFYLGVDHSASTTYVSNLATGPTGPAYWRRPPMGGGTWALSTIVTRPSLRVLCQGGPSGAVPTIASGNDPRIGGSITTQLGSAAGNTTAALTTGFSNSTWLGFGLPLDLSPLGATGCAVLVSQDIVQNRTTSAFGTATNQLSIPNDRNLIGVRLHQQWIVIDAAANPFGVALSAGVTLRLGG